MNSAIRFLLTLLLAGSIAGPAFSAEEPKPDPRAAGLTLPERLDALIERVRLEQSRVETMQAEFEQDKESELFLEPETAHGSFSYRAPDRIRWEYRDPDPIVMLIDENRMLTWYRDLDRAEVTNVKNYSERIFKYLGAGGSLETLMKYFWLSATFPDDPEDPYHLSLEPRYARVAKRLAGLEIWIDEDLFLPIRLRYEEPNGDITEYRFEDLEINVDLPEGRFEVELPSDVTVETATDVSPGER